MKNKTPGWEHALAQFMVACRQADYADYGDCDCDCTYTEDKAARNTIDFTRDVAIMLGVPAHVLDLYRQLGTPTATENFTLADFINLAEGYSVALEPYVPADTLVEFQGLGDGWDYAARRVVEDVAAFITDGIRNKRAEDDLLARAHKRAEDDLLARAHKRDLAPFPASPPVADAGPFFIADAPVFDAPCDGGAS